MVVIVPAMFAVSAVVIGITITIVTTGPISLQ